MTEQAQHKTTQEPWWKVFMPCCVNEGRGGYRQKTVHVQARDPDEAREIAERVFLPRGWDLDDAMNVYPAAGPLEAEPADAA